MDPKLITDVTFMEATEYELTPGRIVEGRGGVPLHILGSINGKFGQVDVPTANGRRYPRKIMQANIDRLAEAVAARGVYGELDHPLDGRTKFQRVSHIVTSQKIEHDGRFMGSWDILDTPNGRIISAICKAQGRIGASTRGTGTTSPGSDGVEDVNDDYRLLTTDCVVDPASKGAYPTLVAEAKDLERFQEMVVTYEILKKDYPGLSEELTDLVLQEHRDKVQVQVPDDIGKARDALKREFEEKLSAQKKDLPLVVLETLGNFRNEVAAQERARLLETLDPVLDRGALEDISRVLARRGIQVPEEYEGRIKDLTTALENEKSKTAEAEGKLEQLQKESGILARLAMEASMVLAAERKLGGKSYREAVLGMVGKPDKYESREAFAEAVDKASVEFEKKEQENKDLQADGAQDQVEKERKEHREKLAALEKKLGEIEESHAAEMEEMKQSHEIVVSELRAEMERIRGERQEAVDKLSRAVGQYNDLVKEAKRFEREALDDEKKYERRIRDLEDRNEELKQKVEAEKCRVKIEQMLIGRPDADKLRPMVERAVSVEEAAAIIKRAVSAPQKQGGRASLAESVGATPKGPRGRGVQQVDRDEDETPEVGHQLEEELEELGVTPEDVLERMPQTESTTNGAK